MHDRILDRKTYLLRQKMITSQIPVSNWFYRLAELKDPNQLLYLTDWAAYENDLQFKPLVTILFQTEFTIPNEANYFYFPVQHAEALLKVDGVSYAGIDPNHEWIPINSELLGKKVKLEIEMMSNLRAMSHPEAQQKSHIDFFVINADEDVRAYYYDVILLREAIQYEKNPRRKQLLDKILEEAMLAVDLTGGETKFKKELNAARNWLNKQLETVKTDGELGGMHLTGHSHIDVSWLWPYSETIRKASRTFATAIRLLEKYPDFVFNCSQPQLYQFVKESDPKLYQEIKKWAKTGRFEVCGAMWVESDCNVPSGESLLRQMLYGSRFFQAEFGVKTRTCWLPDVFGYPASIPTILKHAEVDFFFTTKLHWQAKQPFPRHLFYWKGLDGTKVLTHIPQLRSFYGGTPGPHQFQIGWDNFAEKGQYDQVLFCFGHGDGGGGVTLEMMEKANRMQQFPGQPTSKIGGGQAYFEAVEKRQPDLPVWDDELYLQTHRGTYSTQAAVKRYNRKLEMLFHNLELLSVVTRPFGTNVPPNEIEALWRVLLLHQFHDDLPGSSIPVVYEETRAEMKATAEKATTQITKLMQTVVENLNVPQGAFVLYNPNAIAYHGPLEIPVPDAGAIKCLKNQNGHFVAFQKVEEKKLLVHVDEMAPLASDYLLPCTDESKSAVNSLKYEDLTFENRYFKMKLNPDGTIGSLLDKTMHREVIAENKAGNVIELFQDGPDREAAWNIHDTFEKRAYPLNDDTQISVVETGPVRMVIRVSRSFRQSKMVQDIILYDQLNRIDFDTWVDWQERQVLMKVAFPVAIRARSATYEIQFGAIERATHNNLLTDEVKFEVCGHRWADLSEADYGVSLLNDSKYGWDIKEDNIRLTLLRGADFPDPGADLGEHRIKYALYPHPGRWSDTRTVQMAIAFNNLPLVQPKKNKGGTIEALLPLFSVNKSSVILDTIKPAEDGEGIVLRFYEACGTRGPVAISSGLNLTEVVECTGLENPVANPLPINKNQFVFEIKPFEIKSFKIKHQ